MKFLPPPLRCVLGGLLAIASGPLLASSWQQAVVNREHTLQLTLHLDETALSYEVARLASSGEATVVVERSPLGLTLADADFNRGFEFVSAAPVRAIDDTYELLTGKRRQVRTQAVEQTFMFVNAAHQSLAVVVRAQADGVAFRYALPGPAEGAKQLVGEATGFKLPANGRAWMQPYEKVATWSPAYEMEYQNGIPIGTAAASDYAGWCFPGLFQVRDSWVMITEAGMDGTCYAAHLDAKADGGLYRVRLPEANETYGVAAQAATIARPWLSPWRVVAVGGTPGVIMESNLVTDLSAPREIEDVSWIKPGRVSWSWWSDMSSPSDYHRLLPFVDLSADYGWEYSLIDLGWQEMHHGDIQQLLAYAKAKNVGLILWYNSGGPHNRVPDAGPRDCMHEPVKRNEEMAKLERWGVKGIKVDFMQSDKQAIIQLYIDILRDAARHHLFVDFHGATLPRGWARTFPNLLTSEGVRGAEQYWDPNFAARAHTLHTIYAFTRNVAGSMDYTPVIFSTPSGKQPHQTTYAHELATAVAFESGLQHFADAVAGYRQLPENVQKFLAGVPVTWDETRYVAGAPGESVVLARRHGDDWYVAGLNGEAVAKTLAVPLTFLGTGAYAAEIIADGADARSFGSELVPVRGGETLSRAVLARGGFVGRLTRQPGK